MPTETESAPAPAARTNPMTVSRLAAQAAAEAPVKPWTPASAPPRHPVVLAGLEKAAELRVQGEQLNAQAESITTRAKLTEQRIVAFQVERAELLGRITAAESRDCKAELARNRARIHLLYGKTTLTSAEIYDLNTAVQSLAWLPLFEKELLTLAKTLKARVEKIDEELAGLTALESK